MGLSQYFLHEVVWVSIKYENWNEEDIIVFKE